MKHVFCSAIIVFLLFADILLAITFGWVRQAFGGVSMEELIFHLKVPLQGTDISSFVSFFRGALLPSIGIFALMMAVWGRMRREKRQGINHRIRWKRIVVGIWVVECVVMGHYFSMGKYFYNQITATSWLEDNAIQPDEALLTWPEKKRNLIYIMMESMEASFASKRDGGMYDVGLTPELTEMARNNLSFSDQKDTLGGAFPIDGATWTMGAMFAQTSGLPLKLGIELNSMDQYSAFFPGVTTLGDLLERAGYHNILMIGSDATFGGRRNYFTQHGNYEINDYVWAKENGKIPKDYSVFWGFEDRRLIEMVKEKLLEVSEEDVPFNLTMLTVDSHFPDGYRCELCEKTYDTDYKDAIACSSRQIAQLVAWIQQQDFYANTTVIVTGDHLSMSAEMEKELGGYSHRRVYNCFLNAAAAPAKIQERVFTAMDMFPTTLAALGVQIEGDRLGIGTNLFGTRQTLAEELGFETYEQEISRHSRFFDSLAY